VKDWLQKLTDELSDDPDELSDVDGNEDDTTEGFFQLQWCSNDLPQLQWWSKKMSPMASVLTLPEAEKAFYGSS